MGVCKMRASRTRRFRQYAIIPVTLWAALTGGPLAIHAQVPDHPIITEVYIDPPGLNDGPIGRDVGNLQQEYIEIYLPPSNLLNPALNKDALRLTFYEIEGDGRSSGVELVNYRFDLPTFDLDPDPDLTPGAIPRPSSGIVVLGWVDYINDPPTDLLGTSGSRVAMYDGGTTVTPSDFVFIAINGHHFTGQTSNFSMLNGCTFGVCAGESLIDVSTLASGEAGSGVIQNGSAVYLLVNRDDMTPAPSYVELYDDKDAAHVPPIANADPSLATGSVLGVSSLLDGFAANDDKDFRIEDQPLQECNDIPADCVDLQTVLPDTSPYSTLVPQVRERDSTRVTTTIGNGYARIFVDVLKTTEDPSAPEPDPLMDALTAYRLIRNNGPFFPTPGRAAHTTSAPELGVALGPEQEFSILTKTTGRGGLLSANTGGDFGIDIAVTSTTSPNEAIASFVPGLVATNVRGQSFAFPSIAITPAAMATHGQQVVASVTLDAVNTTLGEPTVLNATQVVTVKATVLDPTEGVDRSGQPFQATVFAAVQFLLDDPGLTNEFPGTDVADFIGSQPDPTSLDTLGNGTALRSSFTDVNLLDVKEFPSLGEECTNWLNPAGPAGRLDLSSTVLNSAEVLSGTGTYDESIAIDVSCVDPPTIRTVVQAINLNVPDTKTFGGTFIPSELVHFADPQGVTGSPRSGLSNATSARSFELVIVDLNPVGLLTGRPETGQTDDFGIVVEVLETEADSPVLPGEFVFLSFTGGLQGADLDILTDSIPDAAMMLIYLDLDNLHDVLGIISIERLILIDGSGNGELDVIEAFSLNPVLVGGCIADSQCSDGVFCNGDELCVAGSCQAAAPLACSDGIACTLDQCNTQTDSCSHTPSNALCDNGIFCDGAERCSNILGCQPGSIPCATAPCDEINQTCVGCVQAAPLFVAQGVNTRGEPSPISNNRYISFENQDTGRIQAIRVTMDSIPSTHLFSGGGFLPDGHTDQIGKSMWVGPPQPLCTIPSIGFT